MADIRKGTGRGKGKRLRLMIDDLEPGQKMRPFIERSNWAGFTRNKQLLVFARDVPASAVKNGPLGLAAHLTEKAMGNTFVKGSMRGDEVRLSFRGKLLETPYTISLPFAVAPDVLSSESGLLLHRGSILFHSDFSGPSFDGWRDHQGSYSQTPTVGLTRYPIHSGTHSLQLSTGAVPYQPGLLSNTTSTYRNMSMVRESGLLSFSGWFAHAGDADVEGSGGMAYSAWGLDLDVQAWDSTSRAFYHFYVVDTGHPSGSPELALIPNDGWDPVVLPDSLHSVAGENEAKWNWNYLRLTVDLSGNGGRGSYVEAQCNHKVFDLRGLRVDPSHAPQAGSAQASFAGGLNAGVTLGRSSRHPQYMRNVLTADNLILTQGDVLA
ncbi:hypothetical protein EXE58_10645 [Nocardioides seonyuensis]|uniref:Uncharacterized protein n=1 Tax=Nocardioides seonyuensis TaxID=2518371 RepID=A0A4P7IJ15_9ACTN|nr:DUF6772 family protein [Nocardioides seonyuensis]QBX55871.1 hypothetical protein EXE58_10645 [Nocardioides seonyuensis]